jgi:hypothetical protein
VQHAIPAIHRAVLLQSVQVVSFLEHATPAFHHAIPFHLAAFDRVQESFSEALRLIPSDALTKYKLVPLRTRRDIVFLGFWHRFAHHNAPSCFNELFRSGEAAASARRRNQSVHERQIPIDGTQSRAFERSAYGPIYTYDSFPAEGGAAPDTSGFQRMCSGQS